MLVFVRPYKDYGSFSSTHELDAYLTRDRVSIGFVALCLTTLLYFHYLAGLIPMRKHLSRLGLSCLHIPHACFGNR